jgi:large subunit ribosomal protein L19e
MDVKRIAAQIMHCGKTQVFIDPAARKDVEGAITRADVRRLIQRGVITKRVTLGQSRARARKLRKQKKKGRRLGRGSRLGSTKKPKRTWIVKIRALRSELRKMREAGEISSSTYRRLYRQAKGGLFKSKSHLRIFIKKSGLYVKEKEAR